MQIRSTWACLRLTERLKGKQCERQNQPRCVPSLVVNIPFLADTLILERFGS